MNEKKTFTIEFIGRKVGAIGVRSKFTKEIRAENEGFALLKLYDTHEHISIISIKEISQIQ